LTPSGTPATTTDYTSSTITIGTGTSAFDVATDSSNDLWVADSFGGKLRLEVPNGSGGHTETVVASGLSSSYGVTVGSTGDIFVGVSGAVDKLEPVAANMGSQNLKTTSAASTLIYEIQPTVQVGTINVVSDGVVNTQSGAPEFVGSGGNCIAQYYAGLTICTLTVTFTPTDTVDYTSGGTVSVQLTVGKAGPVLAWATPTAISFGTALSSALDPTATFNSSAVAGSFTYTTTPTDGSASAVTAATQPAAGSYVLTATFTPTDTVDYTSGGTVSVALTVNQAASTTALVSSINPVLVTNAATFTMSVSSSAGTAAGSVNFLDGTVLLGSVALNNGSASYTTSSLTVGTHSITAVYGGSNNLASSASSALSEVVEDFSVAPGGGGSSGGGGSGSGSEAPSQTVTPGGTATYVLSILPTAGTMFPTPVTLTLSGLPPSEGCSLSPSTWVASTGCVWKLPPNTPLTNVTLNIQLPTVTAHNEGRQPFHPGVPPLLWGLLLLPFAGHMRKVSRRLGQRGTLLMLLAAGFAVAVGLSGCGGNGGFFAQASQTYTITETVTVGSLSHSATITLTVE
jgi:hypothetical protein